MIVREKLLIYFKSARHTPYCKTLIGDLLRNNDGHFNTLKVEFNNAYNDI